LLPLEPDGKYFSSSVLLLMKLKADFGLLFSRLLNVSSSSCFPACHNISQQQQQQQQQQQAILAFDFQTFIMPHHRE